MSAQEELESGLRTVGGFSLSGKGRWLLLASLLSGIASGASYFAESLIVIYLPGLVYGLAFSIVLFPRLFGRLLVFSFLSMVIYYSSFFVSYGPKGVTQGAFGALVFSSALLFFLDVKPDWVVIGRTALIGGVCGFLFFEISPFTSFSSVVTPLRACASFTLWQGTVAFSLAGWVARAQPLSLAETQLRIRSALQSTPVHFVALIAALLTIFSFVTNES